MIAIGTVGSWTRGWWPEAGSWERWTRGGAPPAAEAHATKSHNTFSYIPAHFLTHFPFWAKHQCARAPWAGKRVLCCRCGEPGNPTPVCVSQILHNPTQPFTHLHVSQSYSFVAILHFPAIPLKFAKICWKASFHLKPKPSHVDTLKVKRDREKKTDRVQIFCKSLPTMQCGSHIQVSHPLTYIHVTILGSSHLKCRRSQNSMDK